MLSFRVVDRVRLTSLVTPLRRGRFIPSRDDQRRPQGSSERSIKARRWSESTTMATSSQSAVIFLHGSGDTGAGIRSYITSLGLAKRLADKGVHLEYPTAPKRPYTIAHGELVNVWFDRLEMAPSSPEMTESIDVSIKRIDALVDKLVAQGVDRARIAVGGFSQGGGLTIQLMCRLAKEKKSLAGFFALSSYANDDSKVLKHTLYPSAPFFMAHGEADGFVLPAWGRSTKDRLESLGFQVTWRTYNALAHELRGDELEDLYDFLAQVLAL